MKIDIEKGLSIDEVTSDHIVIIKRQGKWGLLIANQSKEGYCYIHYFSDMNYSTGALTSISGWLISEGTTEAHAFKKWTGKNGAGKFISKLK